MAAAIIPAVTSLAPEIINLVTALVHKHAPAVEASAPPMTGPVKFADVLQNVMEDLNAAMIANKIPGVPDSNIVKTIIQAVVTSLQIAGLLSPQASASAGSAAWVKPTPPAAPVPPAPVTNVQVPSHQQQDSTHLVLKPGMTLTITLSA